jgi:Rho-binding antiterminator
MSDDDDQGKSKGNDNYTPIPCGLYSEYEVAIMHREVLRLHWRDDDGMDHIDRVMPSDLQTRNHCEYLIAEDSAGGSLEIRLDRIINREQEPQ